MALPLKLPLDQMQTRWKSEIDPVLANPILNGRLVTGVPVVAGLNVINHGLGRPLIGWLIVDQNTSAGIYSEQSFNPSPQLSLWLVSSGTSTLSLWVF